MKTLNVEANMVSSLLTSQGRNKSHIAYQLTSASRNYRIVCASLHLVRSKNCAKLEKLQERALRMVFNDGDASYETLCESSNILPLNVYRVRFLGIEIYKCVNGLNPNIYEWQICHSTECWSFSFEI